MPKMIGSGRENRAASHQGEDLRLVADFGQPDDHGRDEERFHGGAIRVGRR